MVTELDPSELRYVYSHAEIELEDYSMSRLCQMLQASDGLTTTLLDSDQCWASTDPRRYGGV